MFEVVIVMKHQERIAVWLQTHDMAGFKICIYTTPTVRKWLPVPSTGLCSCSSSSSEPVAVLSFKWPLSDLRATTSLWLQSRCQINQRPDLSPHIIFNSNEMLTEINMHIQNENPAQFHCGKKHHPCWRTKLWDQTQCLGVCYVSQ